jgi:hypothetical protein
MTWFSRETPYDGLAINTNKYRAMTRNEAIQEVAEAAEVLRSFGCDVAEILAALRTPPTVQDVVRVRELVWEEDPTKSGAHRAHVWFKTYYMAWPRGNWELLEFRSPGMVTRAHGLTDSLAAAYAAAAYAAYAAAAYAAYAAAAYAANDTDAAIAWQSEYLDTLDWDALVMQAIKEPK